MTHVCIFRNDCTALFSFFQMKDFINTYNQVTESCFCDCVHDFTSRRITKQEVKLGSHAQGHYLLHVSFSSRTFSKLHASRQSLLLTAKKSLVPGFKKPCFLQKIHECNVRRCYDYGWYKTVGLYMIVITSKERGSRKKIESMDENEVLYSGTLLMSCSISRVSQAVGYWHSYISLWCAD